MRSGLDLCATSIPRQPMRIMNDEFSIIIIAFVLLLSAAHSYYSQDAFFQLLNISHRPWTDLCFSVITCLGNGFYLMAFCLILLGLKKQHRGIRLLALIVSFVVSSLIVLMFKDIIWPGAARPLAVFGADHLQLVKYIHTHSWHSFPSGHTALAVALLYIVATDLNRGLRICMAFLALLVGYSRIYLNQHFTIDVMAGALVGLVAGMIGMAVMQRGWPVFKPKPIIQ